jgi:hypothetical protein
MPTEYCRADTGRATIRVRIELVGLIKPKEDVFCNILSLSGSFNGLRD